MVLILKREVTDAGLIVEGVAETQAELLTDPECVDAAPCSKFEADDWTWVAKKRLNGAWVISPTGL